MVEWTFKVFCEDCHALVQHVIRERGLNPHDCKVLCGFDGGQGLLKIGFTVFENVVPKKENVRAKYSEVKIMTFSIMNFEWIIDFIGYCFKNV